MGMLAVNSLFVALLFVLFGWLFGGLSVCLLFFCWFVGLLFVCGFCCWLVGHLVSQLVGLFGRKYISKCDCLLAQSSLLQTKRSSG